MIRLYGHQLGQHSFTQVTRGLRLAAEDRKILAGFVPVDGAYDDEKPYPGATADIALNAGAPGGIRWAHSIGQHKQKWLLIAPNSTRIPSDIVLRVKDWATGVLSPSEWGVSVLRAAFEDVLPVRLCQHGVFPEYTMSRELRDQAEAEYQAGEFQVLHLTSTASERKGTRQLLDAWQIALGGAIPARAQLHVLAMHQSVPDMKRWVLDRKLEASVVVHDSGWGKGAAEMRDVYSSAHAVIQPSRAEGFGLCPLEAMACGVPIVATFCTGHWDYLGTASGGVVRVAHFDDAPIGGEGPGALAPSVAADDVLVALGLCYAHWPKLEADARRNAPKVQAEWSWPARSGPALEELVR